jgi:predicted DCC family thiol-disulfide oxidoreductase YuxK
MAESSGLVLVYDGDCPVCSAYTRYLRIKESVGTPLLINARDGGLWVDRIRARRLDLDEGMVLIYGGQYYHGADCIHMLAMLSTGSGFFNRINAWIFRSPTLSKYLYPVLRSGRNLLLRLLNRSRLQLN